MYSFRIVGMFLCLFTATLAHGSQKNCQANNVFNVGAGIYDITGPAAEEGMMGYAMLDQQTAGIYQRLWSRAFIIESVCNSRRVVIVNADLCMITQGVKQKVIRKLQQKYGHLYNDNNVLITATHQHSGPGGYSTYTLYNITTLGFSRKNFTTIVDGIVASIERAQNNLTPAHIKIATGELEGISFNRSPTSYLKNPQSERDRYSKDRDIEMTLLRFDAQNGKPIGLINWFPIHGVSFNNKNKLISGDNKGYAEYLFEKDFHADYGAHSFVAAFAQANAGDVSSNPLGHQGGAGDLGILAVESAGKPQYEKAKALFEQAHDELSGDLDYRHTYVAMDQVSIDPQYTDGLAQKTCTAAIGLSMLAGTQDGEGIGKQGVTCKSLGKIIPYLLCDQGSTPCQGVKPIALKTGAFKPHPWTPPILPLQVMKIGQLIIVATPFELTTMTGRRIRETVAKQLPKGKYYIVLAALSNAYSGYVATQEEYQLQRYEGASTHFGPWQVAALRQEFAKLTRALVLGESVPEGPKPADLSDTQINFQPDVLFDSPSAQKKFGDVYRDVAPLYRVGDKVQVVFWGAHPKNDYRLQDSFLAVQYLHDGQWQTIRLDRDWDTEYHWQREGVASSLITIVWRTPSDAAKGQYRIVHYGNAKLVNGKIIPYVGYSSIFQLI